MYRAVKNLKQPKDKLPFKTNKELPMEIKLRAKRGKASINKINLLNRKQTDLNKLMYLKNNDKDNEIIEDNKIKQDKQEELKNIIPSLKDIDLSQNINSIINELKTEIKQIDNMTIEEVENLEIGKVENMNIEKAVNLQVKQVNQLINDIDKLIKLNIDKDTLKEIIYEMNIENDNDDLKNINTIINKLNESIDKAEDNEEIKKALTDTKTELNNFKESIKNTMIYDFKEHPIVKKLPPAEQKKFKENVKVFLKNINPDILNPLLSDIIDNKLYEDKVKLQSLYKQLNNFVVFPGSTGSSNSHVRHENYGDEIIFKYYSTDKNLNKNKPTSIFKYNEKDYLIPSETILNIITKFVEDNYNKGRNSFDIKAKGISTISTIQQGEGPNQTINKRFNELESKVNTLEYRMDDIYELFTVYLETTSKDMTVDKLRNIINKKREEQFKKYYSEPKIFTPITTQPTGPKKEDEEEQTPTEDEILIQSDNDEEEQTPTEQTPTENKSNGLISENINYSILKQINKLMKDIEHIKNNMNKTQPTQPTGPTQPTELIKPTEPTKPDLTQIIQFDTTKLKHVKPNEKPKTETQNDLQKIMERRRQDLEPDDYETDDEEWADGYIKAGQIPKDKKMKRMINYYSTYFK